MMSLRNRIVVVGLVLTLVAPAAGWAKRAQIDPDGQSLVSTDVSDPEWVAPGAPTERSTRHSTVELDRENEPNPASGSILDRFFLWLRTLVQPI